jgi:hypothetical protein
MMEVRALERRTPEGQVGLAVIEVRDARDAGILEADVARLRAGEVHRRAGVRLNRDEHEDLRRALTVEVADYPLRVTLR